MASTTALRAITALRLYLSAQTPHRGTSGAPTTKTSALNNPTNVSRSDGGTPIVDRAAGSNANTWLTPMPSTIDVSQKTTKIGQSTRGGSSAITGATVPSSGPA